MARREHRQPWLDRLRPALALLSGRQGGPLLWRIAAPMVFVVAGALLITSAETSDGTDLRAGRIADLASLAEAEADDLEDLRERQEQLTADVEELSASLGDPGDAGHAVERADALRSVAGLEPVAGSGLTITLDDAPKEIRDTAETEPENLIVHQQDIQAVVNALWAGGAEAMTIQDQRVVSTTGIRCVGNTVVLHDIPYAPPYRISAIGPTGSMLASVNESPYIGFYLQAVERWRLGWELEVEPALSLPGYAGSTSLTHARPADGEL